MANVQIDNGKFTRVANEILEHIAQAKLNGTQYAIVLTVWRHTYGWGRTEHEFSQGYLAKETGLNRHQIQRELTKLIERKIILVAKEPTKSTPQILKFNKNYDQWKVLAKTLTVSESANTSVSEKANTPVSELANQVKKERKKILKKDKPVKPSFTEKEKTASNYLKDKLVDNGVTVFPRNWHLKQYSIAKLLLTKLTIDEVISCIDWAFNDQYWRTRIDGLQTIQRILPKWQLQKNQHNRAGPDSWDVLQEIKQGWSEGDG